MRDTELILQTRTQIIETIFKAVLLSVFVFILFDYISGDFLRFYAGDDTRNIDISKNIIMIISLFSGCTYFLFENKKVFVSLCEEVREAKKREIEAFEIKNHLVRNMAHDLRTPLTSLIAYTEILWIQNEENEDNIFYIDKILSKAKQIRELSDILFEKAIVLDDKIIMNEPDYFEYAVGDYVSQMCADLISSNISIKTDIKWKPVKVAVNMDYLIRIMENIYSNILCYADRKEEINIMSIYENDLIGIRFQNIIGIKSERGDFAGEGLKSIESLMKKMGGKSIVEIDDTCYSISILFPCCCEL